MPLTGHLELSWARQATAKLLHAFLARPRSGQTSAAPEAVGWCLPQLTGLSAEWPVGDVLQECAPSGATCAPEQVENCCLLTSPGEQRTRLSHPSLSHPVTLLLPHEWDLAHRPHRMDVQSQVTFPLIAALKDSVRSSFPQVHCRVFHRPARAPRGNLTES